MFQALINNKVLLDNSDIYPGHRDICIICHWPVVPNFSWKYKLEQKNVIRNILFVPQIKAFEYFSVIRPVDSPNNVHALLHRI